jgi:HrpA-like RNA helicase
MLFKMLVISHIASIIQLIGSNEVVSVVAPVGSGKSLLLPRAIAAAGAKCFITVHSRTSAISLSRYQRMSLGSKYPATYVGYASEGDIQYTEACMIVYITTNYAKRLLLSHYISGIPQAMTFCQVLLVDNINTGSIDNSVILSLWDTHRQSDIVRPRLVITGTKSVDIHLGITPSEYTILAPQFPITYKYLPQDLGLDDTRLYIETGKLAVRIHTDTPITTGHILVYVPGSKEAKLIVEVIRTESKMGQKVLYIIPAYGELTPEAIAQIYKETKSNERKILVTTSTSENAIAIPDIGYVVDTLGEERGETNLSGNLRVITGYISKDSADERAERAVMNKSGVCYRMCTESVYDKLDQHRSREIDRLPMYDTIFQLISVGLDPEVIIKDVDGKRITHDVALLKRLELIKEDGTISESVSQIQGFRLSMRNSTFLYRWIQKGLPVFPGIVVACLIDNYGPSYYWLPRKKSGQSPDTYREMLQEFRREKYRTIMGVSDLETGLKLFLAIYRQFKGITFGESSMSEWSKNNSFNGKKIRELMISIKLTITAVEQAGFEVKLGIFNPINVIQEARPILLSVYSDMYMIHGRLLAYYSPLHKQEYLLDKDVVSTMIEEPPAGIIALVTYEIKTKVGSMRLIGFALDTSIDPEGKVVVPRAPGIADIRHLTMDNRDAVEVVVYDKDGSTPFEMLESLPSLVVDENEPAPIIAPILLSIYMGEGSNMGTTEGMPSISNEVQADVNDLLSQLEEFNL